jgi:hypothetical protein
MIAKAKTPFTTQLIDFILNYNLFDYSQVALPYKNK